MSAIHFPLQKVLEWRRTQLELEEAQYRRQMAALVALDRRRAEIDAAGKSAERQVREWNPLAGGELAALGGFRLHVQRRQQEMVAPRAECSKQLQRQQEIMLEAKRLLYHSNCSVKEIAHELGYEDHTYFSRLFKKTVGDTPGEFRRHYRE